MRTTNEHKKLEASKPVLAREEVYVLNSYTYVLDTYCMDNNNKKIITQLKLIPYPVLIRIGKLSMTCARIYIISKFK